MNARGVERQKKETNVGERTKIIKTKKDLKNLKLTLSKTKYSKITDNKPSKIGTKIEANSMGIKKQANASKK